MLQSFEPNPKKPPRRLFINYFNQLKMFSLKSQHLCLAEIDRLK
jgi:hypothetical protein